MKYLIVVLFLVLNTNTYALDIAVDASALTINAHPITFPIAPARLDEMLGGPARKTEAANVIYTWDGCGVIGYAKKDGDIYEIDVITQKEPFEFSPRNVFSGKLTLLGVPYGHALGDSELVPLGFAKSAFFGALSYKFQNERIFCKLDTVSKAIGWSRVVVFDPN